MRLHEKVNKEIRPNLAKSSGKNIFSIPNLSKITVTVGIGPHRERKDVLEAIEKELAEVTGQKARFNVAKKSIAGFKLREGQTVGYQVTLRSKRMWDFLEKLVNVVLPRLRDFEGVSEKSFDKSGNLTMSVKDQIIFPEIKADEIKESWGMGVTLTIKNAQDRELLKSFLKELGIIFR